MAAKEVRVAEAKGSTFTLHLNGVKLPAAAEQRIAARLQSVFMEELGGLDLAAKGGGGRFAFIPKEWLGIWLERQLGRGIVDLGKIPTPRGF